jgi:hypothetical protein
MTGDWRRRVGRVNGPRELQELRAILEDLGQQAGHAPGKARLIFQTVSDVAILGTVVLSGALAAVHLWKSLYPRPKEDRHGPAPDPAGADREPPRRRRTQVEAAAGGYEHGRPR